jgi:hypothetical protein
MKRTIFVLLVSLFSIVLKAQTTIPNSNFENWTISSMNTTDSLIGWSSSNAVVISPVISLYKETPANQGNYSVNLVTAPFGYIGYSTIGVLVNGNALFSYGGGGGGANTDYASGGGTPISFKPTSVNGFYKTSTLTLGDLPLAKVLLTKYNSTFSKRDTVSYSEYSFTASTDYSMFSIPLTDLMPGVIPDTITTIFYSSNPATVEQLHVWSDLYLDSIFLVQNNTEIANLNNSPELKVTPNPSNGVFVVSNDLNQPLNLEIYNSLGQKIKSITSSTIEKSIIIDLNQFPAGIYFLKTIGINSALKRLILIK